MATAQKRGFHLPWGSEPNRDEPDVPSLADRLGAALDDLGRGPFDLPPASEQQAETQPDQEPEAVAQTATDPVTTPAPPTEPAESAGPADLPVDAASAQTEGVAAPSPVEPVVDQAPGSWPEADRRGTGSAPPPPPPPSAGAAPAVFPPKRENPLVAGLVRAMRDAAKIARDEAVAELRAESVARGEAIRVEGTTTAAELRKAADSDVSEIREWSKAEMARVKEETESRIVARKAQLAADSDAAAQAVDQRLGQLAATVEAFEAETATFFDHLLAENDPARLAGLAERMPQPPSLGDEDLAVPAKPPLPPRFIAPVVPEASAAAEPQEVVAAAEADSASDDEALDAEAASAAEAAALAGLDGQTQLVVSGLVGVAAIASFKAALVQSPGVSAVSVNAGTDGDVLFTVTHAEDADLRTSLGQMEGFQARVIADDGSSLVVVAHDPAG